MNPIRIALFESNLICEAALAFIFGRSADFEYRGLIDSEPSALNGLSASLDVIIVVSDTVEVDLAPHLHQRFPNAKVLLLCHNQDAQGICAVLQNGVHGCLSMRSTPDELIRATKIIASGEQYLSPTLAMQLLSGAVQKPVTTADPFASLTDREEQIVKLLGIGLSNKEIGWRLTISEKTVKHYLTSILGKLSVRNRVQAALLAAGRPGPVSYA